MWIVFSNVSGMHGKRRMNDGVTKIISRTNPMFMVKTLMTDRSAVSILLATLITTAHVFMLTLF